jgi:erythromycin esterase
MMNRRRLLLGGTVLAAAGIASMSLATSAHARMGDKPVSQDVVAWLKANAMPIATAEPGHGFADLAGLRDVIGDARVVALGEATHGTREFFQLKHRMIEYCVAELGFTMIGFEAEYGATLAVNDYVLGGPGKVADVVGGMGFWTWDNEEVYALVEWVRAWNQGHERKVKFYGFDMQSSAAATLHLLAYLERVAPELAKESEEKFSPLAAYTTSMNFADLSDDAQEIITDQIDDVMEEIEDNREAWIERTSETAWRLARQSVVMLDQYARYAVAKSEEKGFTRRDRAMATNVRNLLRVEGSDAKAVLWAHNGHVKKTEDLKSPAEKRFEARTMGSFLADELDDDYVSIGFAFNQGSFKALSGERKAVELTVGPAPAGFLDAALAATGMPILALDLMQVPSRGPVDAWMNSDPLQRFIGSGFKPEATDGEYRYAVMEDPRDSYNALIFVERTTASRGPARISMQGSAATAWSEEMPNLALAGGDGVPNGWGTITAGLFPYAVSAVDAGSPKGGRMVRIARADAPLPWGDVMLVQTVPAARFRGQELVFSAAMRAETQHMGTGVQLVIKVTRKSKEGSDDERRSIVALQEDGAMRSSGWARRSVSIDVPDDADKIQIGLVVSGNAAGSFGDLELSTPGSTRVSVADEEDDD